MTLTATWGQIHAGDVVRGADQREWAVIARDTEREWVHDGAEARFELELGDRQLAVWRMLADPAPIVRRADHSAMASAVQALITNGIGFRILEEKTVTTAEPQAAEAPIKRDRYGRYLLPDHTGKEVPWTRATTIARVLADEYNLGQWAERMVAKGMALRPDLVAGAAAAHLDRDKGTLQSIAQQAKDHAGGKTGANLGTALHSFTERLDRGEPLEALGAPPPLGTDLQAYRALLTQGQLEVLPEFIERTVVCRELGIAGTIDRMVEYAPGRTRILDLKTGKTVEYGWLEIAVQQAIYANADYAWNPATGRYDPMPEVDREVGYILHLPVGKASAQLWQVNLAEGWRLAQIAVDVKGARSKAKKLAVPVELSAEQAVAVPGPLDAVAAAATRQALAQLWDTYHPQGLWTAEVQAAAQARLSQLQQA